MKRVEILDLFAGPGGWDVGARDLGVEPLGIEWDDAACATRKAAGLRTYQADVAEVNPQKMLTHAGATRLEGLIASPPCQAWSMAGKRGGERDKAWVYSVAQSMLDGYDARAEAASKCEDPRSLLVAEPLRWLLALEPRWLAFEQVPPVLEFWRWLAGPLRTLGYNVWAGVLSAERYGVPQTRKRAILMAHRDRAVSPPPATHQAYVPGETACGEMTMEGELLPWVSMAEALGWGMTSRPTHTITGGGTGAGGGVEVFGSRDTRDAMRRERDAGRWSTLRGHQSVDGADRAYREAGEPAITICCGSRSATWVHGRPATTVNGDPRISKPGHHDEHESGSQQKDAVRVSLAEATVLQGFPSDYPFQGTRTKRFEQVGNAVPPPLARAVLSQLVDAVEQERAA